MHEKILNEIVLKIIKREKMYGQVLVRGVACRIGETWVNAVTKFLPLHRSDNYDTRGDLVYDDFVLFEELISCTELRDLLKELPQKSEKTIRLGKWDVSVSGDALTNGYSFDSGDEYLDVGWYFDRYQYRSPSLPSPRRNALVSKDLPFFPDLLTAIQAHTGIDIGRHSDLNGMVFCLPRYGARIREVVIGSDKMKVTVEAKDMDISDIVGKVYYASGSESKSTNIDLAGGAGSATINFKPDLMHLVLVSRKDSEVLDARRYYSRWGSPPKGFVVEIPQYEIREWIKSGETEGVEFKADIGQPEEFVESVTAFANTKGGVILLGVADNAVVVGLRKRNYEDSISKILRSHCEPRVRYDLRRTQIDGKEIIVMRVEEGEDKPYVVRDKGVYVRANATDRIATRLESDEMSKRDTLAHPRYYY